MPSAVNTGVPFPGGTVNSPGYEQQTGNTLFDERSTSPFSSIFSVDESPVVLQAFGISGSFEGFVQVNLASQRASGIITAQLILNERNVALTGTNTAIVLDMPGLYQLQIFGEGLGQIIVVKQTTAMSYFSWGLAAYANAINQSANPVVPP